MSTKSNCVLLSAALLLLAACACPRCESHGSVVPSPAGNADGHGAILANVVPSQPFIERDQFQQTVNFDLLIRNMSPAKYRLVALQLKVFDRKGKLEVERELNENGTPPALAVIGTLELAPGGAIDVYQPFYSFSSVIELDRMQFKFMFMREGNPSPPVAIDADTTVTIEAHPRSYSPVAYCLPLHRLILVHDGHDFNSHHRRYNLVRRLKTDPATAVSANLYAYDFMRTDNDGMLYRGDPNRKEAWLTYGEPIFAPAAGVVVQAVSDIRENTFGSHGDVQIPASTKTEDPMGFGNHVTLLHSDGRISWLLHMQPASVAVRNGDRVIAGQLLGRVGFSGDSLFPHLHYNVTQNSTYPSQGVPSYFKSFIRVLGSHSVEVKSGLVDTGDLIESSQLECR